MACVADRPDPAKAQGRCSAQQGAGNALPHHPSGSSRLGRQVNGAVMRLQGERRASCGAGQRTNLSSAYGEEGMAILSEEACRGGAIGNGMVARDNSTCQPAHGISLAHPHTRSSPADTLTSRQSRALGRSSRHEMCCRACRHPTGTCAFCAVRQW